MKKHLWSVLILTIFLCSMFTSSFAEDNLPSFSATVLKHPDEVRDFLALANLESVYDALGKGAANHVFAMNFTSTDPHPELSPYKDHIPDFILKADKDIYVYLLGQYDSWDSAAILLGPVALKANQDFKIMDFLFSQFDATWNSDYEYVAKNVHSFTCAAVPVSAELFAMAKKNNLELPDLSTLEKFQNPVALSPKTPVSKPGVTKLTIGLNLYERGTGAATPVVSQPFFHTVPVPKPAATTPDVAATVPQTGDSALPLLWGVAACTSFISMLLLRRRKAA